MLSEIGYVLQKTNTTAEQGPMLFGGQTTLAVGSPDGDVHLRMIEQFTREERIAATLSAEMWDFAVTAAFLVGAGFPAAAMFPAVVFEIVEMATSAGFTRWFTQTE